MFSIRFNGLFSLLFYIVSSQSPYNVTEFNWIEDDSFFDCIAGISLYGQPVGMGVFIYPSAVITAANPLHLKRWTKYIGNRPDSSLEVYSIDGAWNRRKSLRIDLVTGNQYKRNSYWVKVGFDSRHTTVYDFFFITLNDTIMYGRPWPEYRVPWWTNFLIQRYGHRHTYGQTINNLMNYDPYGWKFAAFSYVDKNHITEGVNLRSTYYYWEIPFEDCDEWIPRPWGHFICIANFDNLPGIQNGAALFNGNRLVGLGAFELNKGNESILVFTDLSPYRYYHIKHTTTTTTTTSTQAPPETKAPPPAQTNPKKKFKG